MRRRAAGGLALVLLAASGCTAGGPQPVRPAADAGPDLRVTLTELCVGSEQSLGRDAAARLHLSDVGVGSFTSSRPCSRGTWPDHLRVVFFRQLTGEQQAKAVADAQAAYPGAEVTAQPLPGTSVVFTVTPAAGSALLPGEDGLPRVSGRALVKVLNPVSTGEDGAGAVTVGYTGPSLTSAQVERARGLLAHEAGVAVDAVRVARYVAD